MKKLTATALLLLILSAPVLAGDIPGDRQPPPPPPMTESFNPIMRVIVRAILSLY